MHIYKEVMLEKRKESAIKEQLHGWRQDKKLRKRLTEKYSLPAQENISFSF
jgi:hypothetical protein